MRNLTGQIGKSLISKILKCAWCSYIYFIWQERNSRLNGGNAYTVTHIVDNIKFILRNVMSDMENIVKDTVNNFLQKNWRLSERILV